MIYYCNTKYYAESPCIMMSSSCITLYYTVLFICIILYHTVLFLLYHAALYCTSPVLYCTFNSIILYYDSLPLCHPALCFTPSDIPLYYTVLLLYYPILSCTLHDVPLSRMLLHDLCIIYYNMQDCIISCRSS